jgi:hypothetical protein
MAERGTTPPPRLYVAHTHPDREAFDAFSEHLSAHRRTGLFESMHAFKIPAGERPSDVISEVLEATDIVVFLVSSSFLANPYAFGTECLRAVEMHQAGQIALVPVVVRPCDWTLAPFGAIPSLPEGGRSILEHSHPDVGWAQVARGLRGLLDNWGRGAEAAASPDARTAPGAQLPQGGHRPVARDRPRPAGISRQSLWVLDFLDSWPSWSFTSERILRWGTRQAGHEILSSLSERELTAALNALAKRELISASLAPRSRRRVYRSLAG